MNVLFAIAVTTGILSGVWGWVAVSLGLIGWAGFLGCTAYFACPQGGLALQCEMVFTNSLNRSFRQVSVKVRDGANGASLLQLDGLLSSLR